MKRALARSVVVLFVLLAVGSFVAAEQEDNSSDEGETGVYASFLWVGKTDTDCMLRDTLLTDSPEQCESEYARVEEEVKGLVERRNERGANFRWGVFVKCKAYKNTKEYEAELERYRKQCLGQ